MILHPSAKINLTLRVGPKRDDGFHDVRTLLQSIALADTLTVTARPGPFVLAGRAPGVPADRTNLVWRAADLLWRALGRPGEPRGVRVKLEKEIPAGAGLGGGSADAAATLVALNRIWQARRPRRELVQIAADLGADVPFFLWGGTALGVGRGDELYPVDNTARQAVVVITPSFAVATADAYRWLDEDRANPKRPPEAPAREIEVGWPGGPIALVNDLQAPVARRHPEILEMIDACLEADALGAAMTGSGSAVFGVFPGRAARRAAERIGRPNWRVFVTRTLSRSEAARRIGL